VEFEWDSKKADINKQNYDVSFHEAATVFGDPLAITFFDPDYSLDEERYLTFGQSRFKRLLVFSHADRKSKVRITHARRIKHRERKIYEGG
jgi:uncharacterized DUF497 family protein